MVLEKYIKKQVPTIKICVAVLLQEGQSPTRIINMYQTQRFDTLGSKPLV